MVTIPLKVSEDLARRLRPHQNRLPEIVELGLRQVEAGVDVESETSGPALKSQVMAALRSTGLVTVPDPLARSQARVRCTPIQADGKPASQIIIEQRRGKNEPSV